MKLLKIFICGLFLLSFVGCQTETSELEGFQQTSSGLFYKIHRKGHNEKDPPLNIGDYIFGHLWQYWGDSLIVDHPFEMFIEQPLFSGDLPDGLLLLNIGDSATILMNADSIERHWNVKKPAEFFFCDYFKTTIRIDGVRKKSFFDTLELQKQILQDSVVQVSIPKEIRDLQNYLKRNNITVQPNSDGVYVVVLKPGTGTKVTEGKTAVFDYTGRLINGVIWDSSNEDIAGEAGVAFPQRAYEPKQIKIGEKQWMNGLDNALIGQAAGAKLKIILPSNMVFGHLGNAFVDEFKSVVLDIDLIDVK